MQGLRVHLPTEAPPQRIRTSYGGITPPVCGSFHPSLQLRPTIAQSGQGQAREEDEVYAVVVAKFL
jgi:hypothetical protein